MPQVSPNLTGQVHVAPTDDALFDDLAGALMSGAVRSVEERGEFHMALSGGSTPEPFYMRLVTDVRFRPIPWQSLHIWVVDERCVPPDHEKSNFRMIRETLLDHVPTPHRQIHPMPVEEPDGDRRYEDELRDGLGENGRLDFVLLGVGDDGHTASLFPKSPAVQVADRWVVFNEGPTVVPPRRMTMTYPLLDKAWELAILVTGCNKSQVISKVDLQVRSGGPDPQQLPVTGLNPSDGHVTWYIDGPAAGRPAIKSNI